jgi:hypothetical protein
MADPDGNAAARVAPAGGAGRGPVLSLVVVVVVVVLVITVEVVVGGTSCWWTSWKWQKIQHH